MPVSLFAGFSCIVESPGFFLDFPGPGKSWKVSLVLESPGNESLSRCESLSTKVTGKY